MSLQDSNGSNNNPNRDGAHLDPDAHLGIAGRTAKAFIRSPLSPMIYMAMMLMGLMGLFFTPRQEDPQIEVPMVDIFVQYPGAEALQVSNMAIRPLERIMSEITGVKHVYSATERGRGMVTVEFDVGQEMGPSLVKVNDKLDSNRDLIPPGVQPPMVKAKGIDDVPVVNLTLWSKDLDNDGMADVDESQLRMLAQAVLQQLKEIPDTGAGFVVGGNREQVKVEVKPARLSSYGISLEQVAGAIQSANAEKSAGGVESGNTHFTVFTGSFLKTVDDIRHLSVGTFNGSTVYLHDVATVTQGPADVTELVRYYTGPAAEPGSTQANGVPAVTLAIAKKFGSNGVDVANDIMKSVEVLKHTIIPTNVEVSVTRNYGQTAKQKVNSLILKLFIATGFVFLLVLFAFRAFKPAIVVLLVIPVVLLFTLFVAWISGFTIDRVSLFALIFAIGILVDDAIVVVENIYRRWLEEGKTDEDTAVDAVREVGNPTILATFTVIAALLPMGFVSGMMGPYMSPIPALGSVAMLVSLFAAFVFTPWLAISKRLLPTMKYLKAAEEREHAGVKRLDGFYRSVLIGFVENPGRARLFKLAVWGTFLFFCMFFYFKWVVVKMLPLDNKPEFSVVMNMPEGTALPVTANLANLVTNSMLEMPEVTAAQMYVGTAKPFDFNGMVRHYYLRDKPWQAEVQVQLLDKGDRDRTSHEIALDARERVKDITKGSELRFAIVEMPPGPPVLQSVVAEVHGPDAETRRQVAKDLTAFFEEAPSLVDVDNLMQRESEYWRFDVDRDKAVRRGISVDTINRNLSMALGGMVLGDVKQHAGHEPTNIVIQVPLASRSHVQQLNDLPIPTKAGGTVPLSELGKFDLVKHDPVIFHKDLRPIEFVTADVSGELAAPVYGMFQVQDLLAEKNYIAPDDAPVDFFWLRTPDNDLQTWVEWTGEWTVTFETFRDMGGAFMVAILLIYMLVVWEFGNFRVPGLIMAPIPLTLLGIIPAHMILGAEFTATSMIGWIALAGIIVRNSILLVDFSIHQIQKGVPVVEAVINSCTARTRPIVITALALVAGSSVIITDPIFNGMAISLMFGVIVSTALTLVIIPMGCITASRSMCEIAVASYEGGGECPIAPLPSEIAAQKKAAAGGMSFGMVVWSKLIGLVMMIFYIVRAIVMMLGVLLKKIFGGKKKTVAPPPPPPSAPPTPKLTPEPLSKGSQGQQSAQPTETAENTQMDNAAASEPVPASEQPESAVTSTASAEDEVIETKKSTVDAAADKQQATEVTSAEAAMNPATVAVEQKPKTAKKSVTKKSATKKTASKKPAASKSSAKPAATSASARKTTKKVSKKKTSTTKRASARKQSTADKSTQKPTPRKKPVVRRKATSPAAKAKPAEQTASASGRRGIRLKMNDDDDGLL